MEKPSEQKPEDLDVTFTSTVEGSLLKQSAQESREQLLEKCIEEPAEELVTLTEDIESVCENTECHKCHSSDINKMYIAGHDVLHCICNQCGKEWVE